MGKRLYSAKREAFRKLLRTVRTRAGLTQAELARRLGRHQSYVSDYERGHRRLDWVAVEEAVVACNYDLLKFTKDYQAVVRTA